MNQLRKVVGYWAAAFAILSLVLGLTGCQTPHKFAELPGVLVPKGATNATPKAPDSSIDKIRIGDTLILTFAGMEPVILAHQETIKDDGTISPPEINKSVVAAGKTPSELQKELLKEYQRIYVHPSVNVQLAPRFYYLLGDVIHPGAQQYLGETDVVKAIATAGGLTEFADKGDIQLTRAGSKKVLHFEYKKALQGDPKHKLDVFPGDTIFVPRSIF